MQRTVGACPFSCGNSSQEKGQKRPNSLTEKRSAAADHGVGHMEKSIKTRFVLTFFRALLSGYLWETEIKSSWYFGGEKLARALQNKAPMDLSFAN